MHLFVTPFQKLGEHKIILHEQRVIHYVYRVLRMRVGDIFSVQEPCILQSDVHTCSIQRYMLSIDNITKDSIEATILSCKENVKNLSNFMLIALPNKFSKCELMVQKLTEIGVDTIIFWPAERSILRDVSDKKMQRLQTIAWESVEQCKRWTIPHIVFVKDPTEYIVGSRVVLFDFVDHDMVVGGDALPVLGVVGPEGHFGEYDYTLLTQGTRQKQSLGEHILRTETAAIVGAWWLIHSRSG